MSEATTANAGAAAPAPGKPELVEVDDQGRIFFRLDGERYEVAPPNPLEELPLIRERATAARRDPAAAAAALMRTLEGVPPESREVMAKAMADRLLAATTAYLNKEPASPDEIAKYLDTEGGAALTAWLRLRGNAGVDESKANAIVKRVGLAVWLEQRDRMSRELIEFAKRHKAEQAARAAQAGQSQAGQAAAPAGAAGAADAAAPTT